MSNFILQGHLPDPLPPILGFDETLFLDIESVLGVEVEFVCFVRDALVRRQLLRLALITDGRDKKRSAIYAQQLIQFKALDLSLALNFCLTDNPSANLKALSTLDFFWGTLAPDCLFPHKHLHISRSALVLDLATYNSAPFSHSLLDSVYRR